MRWQLASLVVVFGASLACGSDQAAAPPGGAIDETSPAIPAASGGSASGTSSGAAAVDAGADATTVDAATPAAPIDCKSYPYDTAALLAERSGFGRQTTGGDPKKVYHVTTLASDGAGSLRAGLVSTQPYWIVFDVSGKITWKEAVTVASNKTVDGRGRDILVEGKWIIKNVRNIVLTDLKLKNELEGHCTQKGDVISASGTGANDPDAYTLRDLWLNHLEVFLGGDGLVDINGGSRVTLSWNHFHSHKKGLLLGYSDGASYSGSRMTIHHNFFDRISYRGPQFLGGWAHYYNNYQFEFFYYGAASLGGAQMYSEANIYEARPGSTCLPCKDPNPCGDTEYGQLDKAGLVTDWASNGTGYTKSVGDLALNGATIATTSPEKVFTPSAQYAYTADVATPALGATIKAQAGARTKYCQ